MLVAMLTQCDLIISVEKAVMRLANAVHVAVTALTRQKSLEWTPIDTANSTGASALQHSDLVKAFSAGQVMKEN